MFLGIHYIVTHYFSYWDFDVLPKPNIISLALLGNNFYYSNCHKFLETEEW